MVFIRDIFGSKLFQCKKSIPQTFRQTDLLENKKIDGKRKMCHKICQRLAASSHDRIACVCGGREKQKIKTIECADRQRQLAGFKKIFPGNIF